MYIQFQEYAAIYGPVDPTAFNRHEYEARRQLDRLTTGIDGVKKLREYFPTDLDDAKAVKRCAAAVIHFLQKTQEAEQTASMGRGYVETENGLQGKVITHVSSGNESISYSATAQKTAYDTAAADPAEKNRLITNTIRDYLSGVSDANGVNLLYMGRYPGR